METASRSWGAITPGPATAIRVSRHGKKFTINGPQERYLTSETRSSVPWRHRSGGYRLRNRMRSFGRTKDVSFDIEPGRVVGILGRKVPGSQRCIKIRFPISHSRPHRGMSVPRQKGPSRGTAGQDGLFLSTIAGVKHSEKKPSW